MYATDKQNQPKRPANTVNVANERRFSDQFSYLETIWQDCGELCNTSREGIAGPFFNHVTANIQCDRLFQNADIDRDHGQSRAPRGIPEELMEEFTMNNRVQVIKMHFSEVFLGGHDIPRWTKSGVEQLIDLAKNGKLKGTYAITDINALREALGHAPHTANGRILVIGSRTPWVEACVLEAGAREVVTLDYGSILSQHPQIQTMVPSEFRQKYLNGTLGIFDGIVTFSTMEDSGLGRFGDALNPWGDIITIARAWCVTREGGSLTIGVPYDESKDWLFLNGYRVYRKIRYPYLTTNWQQYYAVQRKQGVYVFTK